MLGGTTQITLHWSPTYCVLRRCNIDVDEVVVTQTLAQIDSRVKVEPHKQISCKVGHICWTFHDAKLPKSKDRVYVGCRSTLCPP